VGQSWAVASRSIESAPHLREGAASRSAIASMVPRCNSDGPGVPESAPLSTEMQPDIPSFCCGTRSAGTNNPRKRRLQSSGAAPLIPAVLSSSNRQDTKRI
jgi:hypothetical protein